MAPILAWLLVLGQTPEVPAPARVTGRVNWRGALPQVQPFLAPPSPLVGQPDPALRPWPNPHAPSIAPDGGLGGILVWAAEPAGSSRTVLQPPVRVLVENGQILVEQGGGVVPVGLLNPGDAISVESRQAAFFTLRGRGTAFFGLPLVRAYQTVRRTLDKPGWVELSSGTGQYWARGWLWVGAPVHTTVTDASGRFELVNLKPGRHTLVARLPDWQLADRQRDPETGELLRAVYKEPGLQRVEVNLQSGQAGQCILSFPANEK